jgi:hypothetical protein
MKKKKKFGYIFFFWICIFALSLVRKSFQNDTFYTIKIGELIFKNGIDMLDHFSFHATLAYTYPHWLYDLFIYGIYKYFGYTGIYISSIVLFIILLAIIFKINIRNCENYSLSAIGVFVTALAVSGFVTARAQLVSFIIFALEVYFIEEFLRSKKKKYLIFLIILSLALCNLHVAVWPFYFVLYMPYLVEYLVAIVVSKIKLKKKNGFIKFLEKKIVLEKNDGIKYLFITMLLSTLTGLMTPIGLTPYTYLIKTMMGNSQKYIQEHQLINWINAPFTIIIAFETFVLFLLGKAKLRDLFMVSGLTLMAIISIRHIALLSVLGTLCFIRIFWYFLETYHFDIDDKVINFLSKKVVILISFVIVIVFSTFMLKSQLKTEYVNSKEYPVKATEYIKKNLDVNKIRLFNEYNFGSYLLFNDIPVFIDSRADLYTKEFSGFDYDIFDDFQFIMGNYQDKFRFYGITHVLLSKKNNKFYKILNKDNNYVKVYNDNYFAIFERMENDDIYVSFN